MGDKREKRRKISVCLRCSILLVNRQECLGFPWYHLGSSCKCLSTSTLGLVSIAQFSVVTVTLVVLISQNWVLVEFLNGIILGYSQRILSMDDGERFLHAGLVCETMILEPRCNQIGTKMKWF